MFARAMIALLLLSVVAAVVPASPAPAQGGGDRLSSYVQTVGMRLVAASGRSGDPWRFAVLDTPEANAFALPGERIFVTRGMLALAGDEAELAAVLGHEIGHALAGDGSVPAGRNARRAAEFAADRTGMRLMAAAGYDPRAQADFLRTLLASRALEARLLGGGRAPARRNADHPALAERLRDAQREAGRLAGGADRRNQAGYMAAIDGLYWGDGPTQGFVRGRSFVHPELGFAFDAPAGYAVTNRPDAVVASGPGGAILLLDSLPDPGGSPEDYLVQGWVPEIGRRVRTGPVERLRRTSLHGLAAAQLQLELMSGHSQRVAELTVVRQAGRFYRLTGLHTSGDAAGAAALAAAAESFRPLSAAEAARLRPLRIRVHRIARGDDVPSMAAAMPVGPGARAWFDVMNGIHPGSRLRVGDLVKVVAE